MGAGFGIARVALEGAWIVDDVVSVRSTSSWTAAPSNFLVSRGCMLLIMLRCVYVFVSGHG